jgi:hypothetical protein
MLAYFERDKLDRQIAVTINIIEQKGDAPFNRGRLANCGFLLTRKKSRTMSASMTWTISRCGRTIHVRKIRRG